MGKYGRARRAIDENMIRQMRLACWITKDTDTYTEYVILIVLPRQQRLRERASVLLYTYIPRVVYLHIYSDICWRPWLTAHRYTDNLSGSHVLGLLVPLVCSRGWKYEAEGRYESILLVVPWPMHIIN